MFHSFPTQPQCETTQTLVLQVSRKKCVKANNPIFMQISFAVAEMKSNIPYIGSARIIISELVVFQNFPLASHSLNTLYTELFPSQGRSMIYMYDRSHSQRRNLHGCNSLVLTMVLPMLAETLHVAHGHPIGQSSFGIQQAGLKVSKQEQKCWNEGEEPFSTFFVCLFCLRGLSLKKKIIILHWELFTGFWQEIVFITMVSLHGIYLQTQSLSLKSLPIPPEQV